ncbi:MAG: hypothetical protein WC352_03395 [Candidatus Omnitrophota bacterium]|jgi:hypothetical protein
MPSLYKQLVEEEVKFGKGAGVLLATERSRDLRMRGVRILIGVLFVLTALSWAGTWKLYTQWDSERVERKKLQGLQAQLEDKAQSFDKAIKAFALESDEKVNALRKELEAGERQLKELQGSLSVRDQELSAVRKEAGELKEKIGELEQKKSESSGPAPAISPLTEIEAIASPAVSSAAGLRAVPVQRSRVLTVNRRFNFVVINLGAKDRLRVGDSLIVERDSREIGTVEVEKTYDRFSAATILKEERKNPLREGDSIRRA